MGLDFKLSHFLVWGFPNTHKAWLIEHFWLGYLNNGHRILQHDWFHQRPPCIIGPCENCHAKPRSFWPNFHGFYGAKSPCSANVFYKGGSYSGIAHHDHHARGLGVISILLNGFFKWTRAKDVDILSITAELKDTESRYLLLLGMRDANHNPPTRDYSTVNLIESYSNSTVNYLSSSLASLSAVDPRIFSTKHLNINMILSK